MVVNPFQDRQISNTERRRTFLESVDSSELVWHRDKKDRLVTVLESQNWEIQYDNELPIHMNPGDQFFIPKNTYHRVIKGTGQLVVDIKES